MEKLYTKEIKEVGLRIKQLRQERDMSQQALAGLCEVDIRTIQRIEKGEFGFGLHILFALSDAFAMSPSKLLEDPGLIKNKS